MNSPLFFREVAEKHGPRTAIAFTASQKLTYLELDRLSDRTAQYLLAQGVQKGDRIGLCLDKCASFYLLVLASLKIGAPYFALDPNNPVLRNAGMIEQCRPRLVFSHPQCPQGSELPEFCKGSSQEAPLQAQEVSGADPAYIMFTSGSTGRPKGAVMSHDNLVHFIRWARAQYGFTSEDIHTHLNPVYFDNSVFDIYATFFTGGTLVPFTHPMLLDPGVLAARLREMRCTVWFSVPSLLMFLQVMKVTTPEFFGHLKKIIFGGEGFPKVKLKALMDSIGTAAEYHNVSGPTECTCICTSYRVTPDDLKDKEGLPPLGSVIEGFKSYVLSGDEPVSLGETGELCLGGPGVGLGYYGQPELTGRVFVQNPLNKHSREILYRTGDLVKTGPDGKLYFVGRKDLQIKHMGYRIELEEIQHALSRCSSVDDSAVVYRRAQDQGEIVAIVATRQRTDERSLSTELAGFIPKYMMPAKIHFVERLPKNASGKTDRQALAAQYGGM